MNPIYLFLFFVTAGINSAAQLLLKRGSFDLKGVFSGTENLALKIFKVFLNPYVLSAAVLLGAGMVIWIKLISQVELSRAYPVNIALTIILTSVLSILFFHESFGWIKFAGTGFIVIGLWLILYS